MAATTQSMLVTDEQRPLDQIPISPPGQENEQRQDEGALGLPGSSQITVFHSPQNFTVKHPLINKWTLWFTKPSSGKGGDSWNDLLKEVVTFDSVEEFWGIYHNVSETSRLQLKSDYHLFKAGIRPEWEDIHNKNGGRWAYQYKNKGVSIDEVWLHVMLAAIGETLEKEGNSEVMGVVVNVRKGGYRIGIWTRTTGYAINSNNPNGQKQRSAEEGKEILIEIGRRFKEVLRLPERELVEFTGHTDSATIGASRAKVKFSV